MKSRSLGANLSREPFNSGPPGSTHTPLLPERVKARARCSQYFLELFPPINKKKPNKDHSVLDCELHSPRDTCIQTAVNQQKMSQTPLFKHYSSYNHKKLEPGKPASLLHHVKLLELNRTSETLSN